jgi:hypothetical protein
MSFGQERAPKSASTTCTNRYQQAEEKTTNNENLLQFERKIKGKSHRTKTREFQPIPASVPSLPYPDFHRDFSCPPAR